MFGLKSLLFCEVCICLGGWGGGGWVLLVGLFVLKSFVCVLKGGVN